VNKDVKQATEVWSNKVVPVALRRGGSKPIRLRIPYRKDNRAWLKSGKRKKEPVWIKEKEYWELPASRFNELVRMILDRFGSVYIIQPYREREVCASMCMHATGFECQCSCMGANHGSENSDGWFEVTDTFAVRFGETQLACRLLRKEEAYKV
jgi:hypothetical protein